MEKIKNLFINRKLELKKLTNGLKAGDDFILVAPRRFGKTALALKVLDEIRQSDEYIIIDIDLMSYASGSIRSVAECIIEKSLNALGFYGKIRRLWRNLDFSFNLKIKYNELEIEPLLNMVVDGDEWALLEDALNLPEKIAIKEKKHVIVFYDEFGELGALGDRIIKLFRSVIQRHSHVSYLFSGSQETVMNKIFANKAGAFYRFGELIYLKELDKKDIFNYIVETYPDMTPTHGGLKDITIIEAVLNGLNGHPYYTAQAIKFFRSNPICTMEEFAIFLKDDLLERERPLLEQQLINMGKKQHAIDVLRVLSLELNPYEELKTLSPQKIYTVLRYLEDSGYVFKQSRGIYGVVDPLLKMLLINVERFRG